MGPGLTPVFHIHVTFWAGSLPELHTPTRRALMLSLNLKQHRLQLKQELRGYGTVCTVSDVYKLRFLLRDSRNILLFGFDASPRGHSKIHS